MLRKYWGHCLIGIGAATAVALLFGVRPVTLLAFGAALACPLMMVAMMGGAGHAAHRHLTGHGAGPSHEPTAAEHGDARETVS